MRLVKSQDMAEGFALGYHAKRAYNEHGVRIALIADALRRDFSDMRLSPFDRYRVDSIIESAPDIATLPDTRGLRAHVRGAEAAYVSLEMKYMEELLDRVRPI